MPRNKPRPGPTLYNGSLPNTMKGCWNDSKLIHPEYKVYCSSIDKDVLLYSKGSLFDKKYMEWLNDVKRFIFCSSMARYGSQVPPFTENLMKKPVDPYGMAKAQAEDMLFLLSDIHGLEVTVAVPHNIIGVGQRYTDPYRNVAAIMINSTIKNEKIYVYGDGHQKRSFSDISDCVKALTHIAESDRNLNREVYNIGPDKNEITINNLAEYVSIVTNLSPEIIHIPDRPHEVKNAYCSSDKIKREFNYNATMPLITTLTQMTDWIYTRGSQAFDYHLPIEITNKKELPQTWKDQLF